MDEEWLASREIRTALALNEIEAGVTFRPVGFLRQPDTKLAVLTQFDEGVTSFDNTLWEKDYIPTKREVEWALSCAAASLVFLHANGYTHGDFQVKNTAYSGASLQSRIIDTTSTKRSADINAFGDDISLYVESLGRFGQQNSHARREDVLEYFIEPYADSIEDIFPKSKQEDMRKIMANLALNMDEVLLGGEFN